MYCLDCLEALTEVCDHCGERFWNSELHREQGLTLCRTCREDEYSYCSSCGLHVHVNRDAFGDSQSEQEEVIARILFFVENHWNELLRFSRRSRSQMEQRAARYGRKDDPKAVLTRQKGTANGISV